MEAAIHQISIQGPSQSTMITATAVQEMVTLKRQIGLKWPFPIGLVIVRPEVDVHLTSHIPSVLPVVSL